MITTKTRAGLRPALTTLVWTLTDIVLIARRNWLYALRLPQVLVFSTIQPVSVVANALRGLILGQSALPAGQSLEGQVFLALVWSAAILAVFVPMVVLIYHRSTS